MMQATNTILQKIKNQKAAPSTPECMEFVMLLMAIMEAGAHWIDNVLRPVVEQHKKEEELKNDLNGFNWNGLLKDKDNDPAN